MLDSDEEGSRKVPSDVIRNLRRNNNRRNRPRTAFNFSPHSISAKFHLGTIGENDFIRNCKFVERLDYQNRILFRIMLCDKRAGHAELAAIKRILAGTQDATIYMDLRELKYF